MNDNNICTGRHLVEAIDNAGESTTELRNDSGASVLAMAHGGRVIGLFAGDDSPNLLWAEPRLYDSTKAHEVFNQPEWIPTGGDRTWIGPEIDTMIGDIESPWDTYKVPVEIDPGNYCIKKHNDILTITGGGAVPHFRTGGESCVDIEKQIRLIDSPLLSENSGSVSLNDLSFTGYEQTTSIAITSQDKTAGPLDIWNLLVLPAGGWTITPTIGRACVKDIMAPSGADRLQISDSHVRFLLDGCSQHKISVRAISLTGRTGYLRQVSESGWSLVVRNFFVNPSGLYVDVPWDTPDEFGYCLQFYNHSEGPDSWGEMEYHTPAIGGRTGLQTYSEVSQVWAFTGCEKSIRAASKLLLNAD